MATETHPVAHAAAGKEAAPGTYVFDAVNNARVAAGKSALTQLECEQALKDRPKPPPVAAPKEGEPPVAPPFVESDAQYLVALPTNYVHPVLDDGRTKTTPPAATRSNA